MLQLFDLATALDEYAADVVALPTQPLRVSAGPSGLLAAVLLVALV